MRFDARRTLAVLSLTAAAASVALPFRRLVLATLRWPDLSWDAASHAVVALDLADHARRLAPLRFVATLLDQHWWPPLWPLLAAPFVGLARDPVAGATMPAFLAFVLTPAVAWLLVDRLVDHRLRSLTFGLTALLFLRSPILLEMSGWSMLETVAGLLATSSFLAFAHRGSPRAERVAALLGAALFFVKVHYGAFLLVTLGVATVLRLDRAARTRARQEVARLFPPRIAAAFGVVGALLLAARAMAERNGSATRLPSVPNVAWALLLAGVLGALARPRVAVAAWGQLPPELWRFAAWGAGPILLWCLDPANVRGWYRQMIVVPTVRAGPLEQVAAAFSALCDEYLGGSMPCALVCVGLLAALALGEPRRVLRPLAAFALWPVATFSLLSAWPFEPRYLGFLAPALLAAAIAGLTRLTLALPLPLPLPSVCGALLLGGLALCRIRTEPGWTADLAARAPYRYRYDGPLARFVESVVQAAPAPDAVFLAIPEGAPASPTIRLGLRLRLRSLAPDGVVVEPGSLDRVLTTAREHGAPLTIGAAAGADGGRSGIAAAFPDAFLEPGPVVGVPGGPDLRFWRIVPTTRGRPRL